METHSFRIVLGDSSESIRKLCPSRKFPHYEIRGNYDIFRSGSSGCTFSRNMQKYSIGMNYVEKYWNFKLNVCLRLISNHIILIPTICFQGKSLLIDNIAAETKICCQKFKFMSFYLGLRDTE